MLTDLDLFLRVVDVNTQPKDRNHAMHVPVVVGDGGDAVLALVPVLRRRRVHARPVHLRDDAGDEVLERPVQVLQVLQARLHDDVDPAVDLTVRVGGRVRVGIRVRVRVMG